MLITDPEKKKGVERSEQSEDHWEAWNYCLERSKSVEVLYKNLDGEQILANVHFTYNPAVSVHLPISDLLSVLDHSVHPVT